MRKDGQLTADRIITTAQNMFLEYGYRGTSVENLVEKVGITKGTFFYHFKNKDELALAAMTKWVDSDKKHYDENMRKAENLSSDPLQQLLIFVGLFIDMMDQITEPYPGCLYAAYVYESGFVNQTSLKKAEEAMIYWRKNLSAKIKEAIQKYKPKKPIDAEALADFMTVTFEGAFVMSKTMNDPKLIANQLREYRSSLEARFQS